MMQQSTVVDLIVRFTLMPLWRGIDRFFDRVSTAKQTRTPRSKKGLFIQLVLLTAFLLSLVRYGYKGFIEVKQLGYGELLHVVGLGVLTMLRVFAAIAIGALWTIPLGVIIGFNSRLARLAQPLVQIAASFPANMLFPLVTLLYLKLHVNFEVGSIPLMMLGTQWYLLFNVIAGAMAIPTDLREASDIFGLSTWQKWKKLILPGIFPYLVTGGVTAMGGAWNASIVSEIVSWKQDTLTATGLGAYISQMTNAGNQAAIIWGIFVMSSLVVLINRLLWRKLYKLAETKYHIE